MDSATDLQLVLVLVYVLLASFLPIMSDGATLSLHFVHALSWCLFHSFGLGLLLQAQSERKFLVRHFLKHYHYPRNDNGKGAVIEAFANWKSIYNMSMCMTYGKCLVLRPGMGRWGAELTFHSVIYWVGKIGRAHV